MSVTSFFEKFVGLQQQRTQTAVASYRELVAGIATGEEPNTAEVERLLAEAKKSLDDLRRDVETYQHRMALRAAVAAMPALEAERRALEQKIAAADKLLEAAENQHNETTRPLHFRLADVNREHAQGTTAFAQLVYTCEDPGLRREMEELESEQRRLEEARRDLDNRARRLDSQAREDYRDAERQLVLSDENRLREKAARCEKEADGVRRELKKVEKAQADLAKRREQLEDRMRRA